MQYGRYQILEKLGEGGMGVVYRARALGVDGFQKPVVIKRIHHHLASRPELLQRFINEAKITMGMTHANVVQVLDLGKIDREYFIALEFVDGRDLRSVLRRCIELQDWPAPEISLLITTQVLRGLDYAHRRTDAHGRQLGLVHRDVTPANILCSFEGDVKLTDFGIALAWAGATALGSIRGSVKFMSPEQARGALVDQRSDIFAVGTMLYMLLCRTHPFRGNNVKQTLERVRAGQFITPSEIGAQLPEALENVILTAMAREPEDRYPTAAAMLSALEHHQRAAMHATPTDLAALMQRLFEGELAIKTDPVMDRLVGVELQINGTEQDRHGVTQFNMTAATTPARVTPDAQAADDATGQAGRAAREFAVGSGLARWRHLLLGVAVVVVLGLGATLLLALHRHRPARETVLVVKTEPPGAEVWLDRKRVDRRAPVVVPHLKRGTTVHVEARLAEHVPVAGSIRLNRATTMIQLQLRPAVAPSPGAPPDAGRLDAPPRDSAPLRPPRRPACQGTVQVTTHPAQAEVELGTRRLGRTPCRIQLPCGDHTLHLVNAEQDLSVARQVRVARGAQVKLQVSQFGSPVESELLRPYPHPADRRAP